MTRTLSHLPTAKHHPAERAPRHHRSTTGAAALIWPGFLLLAALAATAHLIDTRRAR